MERARHWPLACARSRPGLGQRNDLSWSATAHRRQVRGGRLGQPQFRTHRPGEEPNVYTEHLDVHGEGLHHLGYFVDDIEMAIAEMQALGYEVVQAGRGLGVDGDGAYAYFDTVDALGCMLEAIEPPRRLPDPIRWYPAPPD